MRQVILIVIKDAASRLCEDAGRAAPSRHGLWLVAPMVLWGLA